MAANFRMMEYLVDWFLQEEEFPAAVAIAR
jgi:hypothetical protein